MVGGASRHLRLLRSRPLAALGVAKRSAAKAAASSCRQGVAWVSAEHLALAAGAAGALSLALASRRRAQCWSLWGGRSYDIGVEAGSEGTLLSHAPVLGKAVDPKAVDMVLFHGGCPDGFAAAFAAYLVRGLQCTYIGIGHGPGKRLPEDIDGKVVAILDFSFDKATMQELLRRAKGVVVLDHHASAQEALAELPEENKLFEMKMSGATLAWDFFHGGTRSKPCPLIFRYIEDRDIWRWKLRRSKAFSAAQELELPVPPPGRLDDPAAAFAPWQRLYDGGDRALDAMIGHGTSIVAYQDKLVKNQMASAKVRRLKLAPEHKVYVVNCTVLPSELGNALALKGVDEGVGFVMCVKYLPGKVSGQGRWTASLRSLCGSHEAAADVSKIAKLYGGGGHRAASGMAVEIRDLEELFAPE